MLKSLMLTAQRNPSSTLSPAFDHIKPPKPQKPGETTSHEATAAAARAPAVVTPLTHYQKPLLDSPFLTQIASYIETQTFTPWAGYNVVDHYSSIEQEYFAIRNTCGLFDLSPIAKYRIAGCDALRYLNHLVTCDVRELQIGQAAYTIWCDDAGRLIDQGILFHLSKNEFRLCVDNPQLDWLLVSACGFDVEIEDLTQEIAALALHGPASCSILKHMGFDNIELLKPFEIRHFHIQGLLAMVSRTSCAGELSYEIWIDPAQANLLWKSFSLMSDVRLIGWAARNMARIEAGFISSYMDFVPATRAINHTHSYSPYELGLGWAVDLNKGHFTGRRALIPEQVAVLKRQLVSIEIESRGTALHAPVFETKRARRKIGMVTSAVWSPARQKNIALATVQASYAEPGKRIWIQMWLDSSYAIVPAHIVERQAR